MSTDTPNPRPLVFRRAVYDTPRIDHFLSLLRTQLCCPRRRPMLFRRPWLWVPDLWRRAGRRASWERSPLGATMREWVRLLDETEITGPLPAPSPGPSPFVPLPPGASRTNGGQACDAERGPCACGAWHEGEEER